MTYAAGTQGGLTATSNTLHTVAITPTGVGTVSSDVIVVSFSGTGAITTSSAVGVQGTTSTTFTISYIQAPSGDSINWFVIGAQA
jgi:ribulose-5-phosphate 4-epimerase/fuculose-1-phosphate aldolase